MKLEKAFHPRETRNKSKCCSVLFAHRTGESLKLNITLNLFVFFCDFRGQPGFSG